MNTIIQVRTPFANEPVSPLSLAPIELLQGAMHTNEKDIVR
jgi:hypothetical protein